MGATVEQKQSLTMGQQFMSKGSINLRTVRNLFQDCAEEINKGEKVNDPLISSVTVSTSEKKYDEAQFYGKTSKYEYILNKHVVHAAKLMHVNQVAFNKLESQMLQQLLEQNAVQYEPLFNDLGNYNNQNYLEATEVENKINLAKRTFAKDIKESHFPKKNNCSEPDAEAINPVNEFTLVNNKTKLQKNKVAPQNTNSNQLKNESIKMIDFEESKLPKNSNLNAINKYKDIITKPELVNTIEIDKESRDMKKNDLEIAFVEITDAIHANDKNESVEEISVSQDRIPENEFSKIKENEIYDHEVKEYARILNINEIAFQDLENDLRAVQILSPSKIAGFLRHNSAFGTVMEDETKVLELNKKAFHNLENKICILKAIEEYDDRSQLNYATLQILRNELEKMFNEQIFPPNILLKLVKFVSPNDPKSYENYSEPHLWKQIANPLVTENVLKEQRRLLEINSRLFSNLENKIKITNSERVHKLENGRNFNKPVMDMLKNQLIKLFDEQIFPSNAVVDILECTSNEKLGENDEFNKSNVKNMFKVLSVCFNNAQLQKEICLRCAELNRISDKSKSKKNALNVFSDPKYNIFNKENLASNEMKGYIYSLWNLKAYPHRVEEFDILEPIHNVLNKNNLRHKEIDNYAYQLRNINIYTKRKYFGYKNFQKPVGCDRENHVAEDDEEIAFDVIELSDDSRLREQLLKIITQKPQTGINQDGVRFQNENVKTDKSSKRELLKKENRYNNGTPLNMKDVLISGATKDINEDINARKANASELVQMDTEIKTIHNLENVLGNISKTGVSDTNNGVNNNNNNEVEIKVQKLNVKQEHENAVKSLSTTKIEKKQILDKLHKYHKSNAWKNNLNKKLDEQLQIMYSEALSTLNKIQTRQNEAKEKNDNLKKSVSPKGIIPNLKHINDMTSKIGNKSHSTNEQDKVTEVNINLVNIKKIKMQSPQQHSLDKISKVFNDKKVQEAEKFVDNKQRSPALVLKQEKQIREDSSQFKPNVPLKKIIENFHLQEPEPNYNFKHIINKIEHNLVNHAKTENEFHVSENFSKSIENKKFDKIINQFFHKTDVQNKLETQKFTELKTKYGPVKKNKLETKIITHEFMDNNLDEGNASKMQLTNEENIGKPPINIVTKETKTSYNDKDFQIENVDKVNDEQSVILTDTSATNTETTIEEFTTCSCNEKDSEVEDTENVTDEQSVVLTKINKINTENEKTYNKVLFNSRKELELKSWLLSTATKDKRNIEVFKKIQNQGQLLQDPHLEAAKKVETTADVDLKDAAEDNFQAEEASIKESVGNLPLEFVTQAKVYRQPYGTNILNKLPKHMKSTYKFSEHRILPNKTIWNQNPIVSTDITASRKQEKQTKKEFKKFRYETKQQKVGKKIVNVTYLVEDT